jgi:hypothetical protein
MQDQLEHTVDSTCLILTFSPAFFSTKYFRESPTSENDFTLLFGVSYGLLYYLAKTAQSRRKPKTRLFFRHKKHLFVPPSQE